MTICLSHVTRGPGQAIAPRLLHAFLETRAPFGAGRFCDLDAGVWDRYDALTCNRLGRALVAELQKSGTTLQATLGHVKLPMPEYAVQVEDLQLEARTFNSLHNATINQRPGGLGSFTVGGAPSWVWHQVTGRSPDVARITA